MILFLGVPFNDFTISSIDCVCVFFLLPRKLFNFLYSSTFWNVNSTMPTLHVSQWPAAFLYTCRPNNVNKRKTYKNATQPLVARSSYHLMTWHFQQIRCFVAFFMSFYLIVHIGPCYRCCFNQPKASFNKMRLFCIRL